MTSDFRKLSAQDLTLKHFFVSYNTGDEEWAKWIAWQLEQAGFSTIVQAWDFRPGMNFVLEMHKATQQAQRTIAVISPAYLRSNYTPSEWAAAFSEDPKGSQGRLVPVIVKDTEINGLLKPLIYIDLTGCDEEQARGRLLDGVRLERQKPAVAPAFPGAQGTGPQDAPTYPGRGESNRVPPWGLIRTRVTDRDKDDFIRKSFSSIREELKGMIASAEGQTPGVTFEFDEVSRDEARLAIYEQGQRKSSCRIWIDQQTGGGLQIGYCEGHSCNRSLQSYNDILTAEADDQTIFLRSSFRALTQPSCPQINLDRMSPENAAEYLMTRLTRSLR